MNRRGFLKTLAVLALSVYVPVRDKVKEIVGINKGDVITIDGIIDNNGDLIEFVVTENDSDYAIETTAGDINLKRIL